MHALHVFRRSLDAGQNHGVALRLEMHGLVGVENQLARSGAGRSRQSLGKDRLLGSGIERRMQELVELAGVDALHRLFAGDQAISGHFDGDPQRGLRGALAGAGLQDEELAFLHRELDVLDVAEMGLELGASRSELGEHRRHERLQRWPARVRAAARLLGQGLRRAHTRHHVLALGVDQKLAEKLGGAG